MRLNDVFFQPDLSLLESKQNYEAMFTSLLNNPELDQDTKIWVRDTIAWARGTLKKSDRVVWFLRYVKALCMDAVSEDVSRQLPGEAYVETFDPDCLRPNAPWRYHVFATKRFRDAMSHFMSLDCYAIQNMIFGKRPVAEVMHALQIAEEEWKNEAKSRIPDSDPSMDGVEKIIDFGNGWAWFDLHRSSCSVEGAAMGHCGNSPLAGTDADVLSLRQAHRKDDRTMWEPHLTFTLDASGYLVESKGKGNDKPSSKYHKMIVALLLNPVIKGIRGGGYLPENNFSINDLSPEDRQSLVSQRPQFGNAYEYYQYADPYLSSVMEQRLKADLRENDACRITVNLDTISLEISLPRTFKECMASSSATSALIPSAHALGAATHRGDPWIMPEEMEKIERVVAQNYDAIADRLDELRAKARKQATMLWKEVTAEIPDITINLGRYYATADIPVMKFLEDYYGDKDKRMQIVDLVNLSSHLNGKMSGIETYFKSALYELLQEFSR